MKFTWLSKRHKTNKQVQEYLRAVKQGRNSVFVIETKSGWRVQPVQSSGPIKTLRTQLEAVSCAKQIHHNQHGEVFVYSMSGALLERTTA